MTRIAVVGCGHWGTNHLRVLAGLPDVTVVCAVDPDPARLERIRTAYPDVSTGSNYRDVVESASIDAVVVATPTTSHFPIAHAALSAGKHVLCEKPMTQTAAEAHELIALADRLAVVLMVGHVYLFHPALEYLSAAVDGGELGGISTIVSWRRGAGGDRRTGRAARDHVSVIYDLASHDIAIANWLLASAPTQVVAVGSSTGTATAVDEAVLRLRYPGDVLATMHASWASPTKTRQLRVEASRGVACWDEIRGPLSLHIERGALADHRRNESARFDSSLQPDGRHVDATGAEEPLLRQDRHFLDVIRTGGPGRSSGRVGLDVVAVLEAATLSVARNGEPVDLRPQAAGHRRAR